MLDQLTLQPIPSAAEQRVAHQARNRLLLTGFAALAALLVGAGMLLSQPYPAVLAWTVYLLGAAAILYRPRYGLYLTLFFTLIADTNLIIWWPFTINFSSDWSLFYIHPTLVINPLEVYLILTLFSWLAWQVAQKSIDIFQGRLFWPAVVFFLFTLFGLAYGMKNGGDRVIALWEARPLFYLVLSLFLTSNLITRREHVNHMIWWAMLAIFIVGIAGNYIYFVVLEGDITGIRSMALHATALQMNTVFVLILAAWFYKASWGKRLFLPLLALVLIVPYFVTQRRAAFLSLGIALVLMTVLLFRERRRLFWWIIPPLLVATLLYTAAFWNSTNLLGKPARAIKSMVVPEQADFADSSSNYYRVVENANLSFTIHTRPLTGVGFGQKFYVVWPMADISFFDWWQYMSHNSIIWIWLKMGAGGFAAMLFLIGSAILLAGETMAGNATRDPDLKAIALTLSLYLVMHFLYAYVDISWDARSMVYIGSAMGILNRFHLIAKG